mmetsp:Transcript_16552/g.30643  ORF Transcript_16552/g.30643 Transcript_16552/m.30643 type:complete len:228 (-) Transcript_16552:7-690(-)
MSGCISGSFQMPHHAAADDRASDNAQWPQLRGFRNLSSRQGIGIFSTNEAKPPTRPARSKQSAGRCYTGDEGLACQAVRGASGGLGSGPATRSASGGDVIESIDVRVAGAQYTTEKASQTIGTAGQCTKRAATGAAAIVQDAGRNLMMWSSRSLKDLALVAGLTLIAGYDFMQAAWSLQCLVCDRLLNRWPWLSACCLGSKQHMFYIPTACAVRPDKAQASCNRPLL